MTTQRFHLYRDDSLVTVTDYLIAAKQAVFHEVGFIPFWEKVITPEGEHNWHFRNYRITRIVS
jgi:hypothetical protein